MNLEMCKLPYSNNICRLGTYIHVYNIPTYYTKNDPFKWLHHTNYFEILKCTY